MSYDDSRQKLIVLMETVGMVGFYVYIICLFSEIQLRYKHFNELHKKFKYAKTDV